MTAGKHLGNRIAPARFLLFLGLFAIAGIAAGRSLDWRNGILIGFDVAAVAFLLSCIPLLRGSGAGAIRVHAAQNDANRVLLLILTGAVTLAVLTAVGAELMARGNPDFAVAALVIATLALAWLFSNAVYALHYAHLFYREGGNGDSGGIVFPGTKEPDYWDFVYFAFTLGMTFQTSDIQIESRVVRRTATFHCLAAFIFNIGVLAFTINILGS